MTDLDQIIRGAVAATSDRRTKQDRGRTPQVSLLPAEIRGAARGRRVRILLVGVVAATALAVGAATAGATASAADADARQAAATARLSASAAQITKFRDVQALQQHIVLGTAAQRVGSSTAIDWQRWRALVLADMPFGFTVTSVVTDSATPFLDYPQGLSPIEKPRAATITVTATTASLDAMPLWLRRLKALPALADLQVPSSTSDGSVYTVQVVVHLTTAAYETPLKGTK